MGSNSNIQPKSETQPNWKHLADAPFYETPRGTHALCFIKLQEKFRNGARAKNGIRNKKLYSSTRLLIGIF